jgi:hypothetical protein
MVYAEPKGTVEARVKQGVRELERTVGDHLLFAGVVPRRKHSLGVVAWLEPYRYGGVEIWVAAIDRRGDRATGTGITVTHHALQRLFQRLATTRLPEVAKALSKATERLVAAQVREGLPREFAVPVADGHLLFATGDKVWTATTYLGPGMKTDLPVVGNKFNGAEAPSTEDET